MDEQELQEQREQKQRFLIDEIIEGGHDPGQFKEYLDNLKPDGKISHNSKLYLLCDSQVGRMLMFGLWRNSSR